MSSAALGNSRVDRLAEMLSALGYSCAPLKASGRAGARRRRAIRRVAGDLIAYAPPDTQYPHVHAEVGGVKKPIRRSFEELRSNPANFCVPLVARVVKRRWVFHADVDSRHDSLADCLEAMRDA